MKLQSSNPLTGVLASLFLLLGGVGLYAAKDSFWIVVVATLVCAGLGGWMGKGKNPKGSAIIGALIGLMIGLAWYFFGV